MKKIITLNTLILIASIITFGQSKEQLLINFQESDWAMVKYAKQSIENMEGECVAELIDMLNNDIDVPLVNTGDLIYPGARKFYGHGQIIDYDIDNIPTRAGWVLEEITFNNFGFSGVHIQSNELIPFIKRNFTIYYSNNKEEIEKMQEEQLRELIKAKSINRAKSWWSVRSGEWSRLKGLMNALQSQDEKRQVKALSYLRHGTTFCSGLTYEYYEKELYSILESLTKSDIKRVSEQAKLILDDTKLEWLEMKL